MSDLANRLTGLSAEKRALFARMLRKKELEARSQEASGISPRPDHGTWPLSYAQERFWFLQRYAPESSFYNDFTPLQLAGSLDVGALRNAIDTILQRHEVLRARFSDVDGNPVQTISPFAPSYLATVDLAALPEPLREREARGWLASETERPFDLTCGPLLRPTLILYGATEHWLLLSIHHIATDGWSWGLLMREIGSLYEAFLDPRRPQLPELSIQYADYAAWQRRELSREILEKQLAYWKEALRDLHAALDLPFDRQRPAMPALRGASESFTYPRTLLESLEALGRRRSMTSFMVLLAALQSFLGRYTGQDDVAIGTLITGRNHSATHGLIGVFINLLVLRARMADDPMVLGHLERVRQMTVDAYDHQDLPFDHLVEALQPDRSNGHQPLVQVVLAFQEEGTGSQLALTGLAVSPLEAASPTANYDLYLSIAGGSSGIHGLLRYDADLFDRTTIQRLVGHFWQWLKALTEAPELRLSEIALLGQAERHHLLREWNDTCSGERSGILLRELLSEQTARTPEAVAVAQEGTALSYRELDLRSNRLAARLRTLGVGPEICVAVALERSVELIIAFQAILKAGGVYLPLDPRHPAERHRRILVQVPVAVVMISLQFSAVFAESVSALSPSPQPLWLEDFAALPVAQESEPSKPSQGLEPGGLAYLIFTSGSTGVPKGAMVVQRGMINHLCAKIRDLELTADDVVAQTASQCFDISIWQFLAPLLVGGRVQIYPDEVAHHPGRLLEGVSRDRISVLEIVPSVLQTLLDEAQRLPDGAALAFLRWMIPTGEALPPDLAQRWMTTFPNVSLLNAYGPTECSDDVTHHRVKARDLGRGSVPIGMPVDHTQLYVLSSDLAPVPPGVRGELWIGGRGVGRGYLGEPAKTAGSFRPDPFGGGAGERLYRTGDLVRRRPDGAVLFLGRLDHQVKVRGFRIELGEIEHRLVQATGISQAIVVVREDRPGEHHLVAYVVPEPGTRPVWGEVRSELARSLPEYMLPTALVTLDALPLTPNGKVDRRALPAPERGTETTAPLEPRTPVEEVVAAVWGEVLGIEQVGLEESFFAIGGHSLLATRVISRLRTVFGVEVPLRRFFQLPTVAGLAAALVSERGDAAAPIAIRARPDNIPLSFAQERLWFLHQLEPRSAAYNLPAALHLLGRLDDVALEACFGEIVRRHETLRTTFEVEEGFPVQRIAAPFGWRLPIVELGALPAATCAAEMLRLVREEAELPFDLATGPLLRIRLLRLADKEQVLLLDMHHAVSDGWSMEILVREAAALYGAALRGEASPLTELPVQYADFALWQREWLSGEVLERQLEFWRRHLAGAPLVTEIPPDRPRPPIPAHRGARMMRSFPASIAASLRARAHREGATSFMALLAGFAVLLGRCAGQDRVVIGTPIANRTRTEIEPLIGFFVNTLALHLDLRGDPSLRELLVRVRGVLLDAYSHQDLPFEKLVEELQPERALRRQPLFQVMLALQNTPSGFIGFPDLTLRTIPQPEVASKFDLSLFLEEEEDGFIALSEHDADLFDSTTVQRLVGHFGRWLAVLAEEPERRLSEVSLLGETERHQLLVEWNDTAVLRPAGVPVHELVARQAARRPDAAALRGSGGAVTYRELADRANRLARRLRRAGVGLEEVVALLLPRTPDVVVAMLAVLEAGAAYLPLDPAYPVERLALMVADARCRCLLAAGEAPEVPGVARLRFAEEELLAAEDEEGLPGARVAAENLAYIIYTSGSTGRPKGVAVPHGSLLNLIGWHLAEYPVAPGERVSQVAGLAFDASVWEVWPPLTVGGCLCFAGEELRADPPALAAWLTTEEIDWAFAPTPLAEGLLQADWSAESALRTLATGGDALRRRPAAGLPWRLVNHYGPTENAVVATHAAVPPADPAGSVPPPIGRPIDNVRALVVDIAGQPAPAGIPGELLLGGASLARGYLGRPDLTAERFVPDPWGDPGERLYRTGDLVRRLSGGDLAFSGRIDRQVKVRGFRIELGEIEAVLATLPAVREAVVEAVSGAHDASRRLIAYVVPEGSDGLSAGALREALGRRLPDSMIPAAWVLLPTLPLTPNGKVDRAALAALAPETGDPAASQAPRTLFEEILAEIWRELLGRERIGIQENFFEAGGHSLLATQLTARVRRAFGVELPLRTVFEEPTLAGLATRIELLLQGDRGEPAPPLVPLPRGARPPLSFAQERLWFIDQLRPGGAFYNISLALLLTGPLQPDLFASALLAVVERHESLRTTFAEEEGRPFQVIGPGTSLCVPLVDLAAVADRHPPAGDAAARRLALEEAARPFDLVRGPLLRATLLRRAADDHLVLFTVHHIAADGWSMGLLIREVGAAYAALARGQRPAWEPLPVQYADFAAWQREWLTSAFLARQSAWWRECLAGAPSVLDLPLDRPRPAAQSFRGGVVPVALGAADRALRELCRSGGATPFMALLALFQALLARWSGQESVVVGSPVAGRNRWETEGLIGFFVNTLPLLGRIPVRLSFRGLLAQVRETTIGAYVHQDLPFEKLVEEVQPERSLAHSPVFQALFVFQTLPPAALELPELRMELVEVAGQSAKFDLTLFLAEGTDGLAGSFEYAADLWDAATARRLAGHLTGLVAAAVAAPDRPLWELPFLPEHEQAQLLVEWNDTAATAPPSDLADLLCARAAASPDAQALVADDGSVVRFGELFERSRNLALRLRRLGVGPGVLTGICLERSPDLIVALLAVVEAGGAYLPLDPSYPPERLALLVEDARPRVLLSTSDLLPRLPAGAMAALCLDAADPAADPVSAPFQSHSAGPGDLLYVIYTSGSTGRPKGAGVYRGAFLNLLCWYVDTFEIDAADRFLLVSSFSFDLTQKNLFAPMLAGASLHLPPAGLFDTDLLVARVASAQITRLNCTPSAFYPLVERADLGILASLRTVFLGGEPIQEPRLACWRAAVPGTAVVNTYGPTECTDVVAFHPLGGERTGRGIPVGRPVRNARLYVVDHGLQPSPVGVMGQIAVGGECVGAGYLGDAALTASRFVPDPSAVCPGTRLYLTGDRGRFLPTGELEYLGRADFQVKVRGFRVEIGEVEAVLAGHPEVAASAVVARPQESGTRLVAYVVAAGEPGRLPAGLREHLAQRLPDFMVPSLFVPLAALPLSPNGKVDRRALPEPAAVPQSVARLRWRTAAEEMVAGLWADVLQLDEVGPGASFFDLGGHSLLASQAVARLRRAFDREVSLSDLFEARDAADLARRIAAGSSPGAPPLLPVPRPAQIPLSFAQERLWFLQQLDRESSAYHIPLALDLHGSLAEGALERALAEMVRRHEALRTTFVPGEDGEPRQRIPPPEGWRLPLLDLSALPASAAAAVALRLAVWEAVRPFDLAAGPPARACLLRRGPGAWTLLVTLHHIVSDGWSMEVLVRELGALYAAFAAGRPSPLPDLPVQYADYALWQRGWLTGDVLARQLDHWRRALAGASLVLALPTDRPRPAVQRFRAGAWSQPLPDPAATALRGLGRSLSATPFMCALSLLQLLLARWTGQNDLLVGSPVANRDRVETEGLIGFFVNTLVLRGGLAGDPSFAELVGRARRTVLAAVSHQDLPFEKLVEALQPERALATAPLFQVLLVWQAAPAALPAIPDLRLTPWSETAGTGAKFDLTLSWNELPGGGAAVSFEYDADLFDRPTVARLAARLVALLAAAGSAPGVRVSELPLLALSERQQIVVEWGDGGAVEPPTGALHTFFERQAEHSPGALALVAGGERLTYAELDRRAERVALHLRRAGVGPEETVGVLAERSAALVAGMLGVLKAGSAYVPIDPAHPRERQAFLLADACVRVLLVSHDHVQTAVEITAGTAGVTIFDLDATATPSEERETGRERPALTPGHLAYLIYTSGSTGLPKGVAIEHRSAVALVAWARQVYTPEDLAGVLFATSINFDLSIFELFVPLSSGGCVVLAANALELPTLPAVADVRLVNTVPSALAELVRAGTLPPGVRTVNLAGEPLTRALADQIHGLGTVETLFNLYGPSEDTTYSTFARIHAGDEPSIGRPLPGTWAYVLDGHLQPAPAGAPGELYLAGEGLARCYLNRPDLTAERFLPDPFQGPGGRLYRTGDVARWRPDGTLDFLGRIDHQVKVRGFRVELGEVEAALLHCAGVLQAVVLAFGEGADRRLVAFIAAEGAERAVSEHRADQISDRLHAALTDRLPSYMVPSAFLLLDSLPLTPNGKIDRQALARMAVGTRLKTAPAVDLRAARTTWEELAAGIWAEVLGVPAGGLAGTAHFFDLGGHSLLATRVVSRVAAVLGVEVPLRLLFERPTLERFAEALEVVRGDVRPARPPLTRVLRQGPLPLSFAQERLWFLEQLIPGTSAYNIPLALHLRGRLDRAALACAHAALVHRHEGLRTTFDVRDGQPLQRIAPPSPVQLPVVDLRGLSPSQREAAARRLGEEEGRRSFDLARGPLLRLTLLWLAEEGEAEGDEHLLLANMHHIVSDGWSLDILIRELAAVYGVVAAGLAPALPPLPIQYADFAAWQRTWLTEATLAPQWAYWRARLAGAPALTQLPADRPRLAVQRFRGAVRSAASNAGLLQRIAAVGRLEGATLFMVLLAALDTLLLRHGGQEDLVVGSPIAGRNRAETEGVVGLFLNTLALRTDAAGDPPFRDLLGRIRATTLDAYGYQDVPFEKLVEELAPERSLSHAPLFQVLLVLQNTPLGPVEMPGIALTLLPIESAAAKLDLSINLTATGAGLLGSWIYNRDLFDAPTVDRLAGHFEALLAAVAADPGRRLSELPLLPAAQRHQMLVEWQGRPLADPRRERCLHDLIAEQAERTPGTEAVRFEGEVLAYADLEARANLLAWRLRELGVGPDVLVGICAERSLGMVVGLLAILKAGGAYVPLDPSYPEERLAFMLEDSAVPVLLTQERLVAGLLGRLPAGRARTVLLDDLPAGRRPAPASGVGPDNLAYVIYTSGSTGRPKGAMNSHRAIVNRLLWMQEEYRLDERDRVLQKTPFSFDVSVWEFFWPLLVGAGLVVARPGGHQDSTYLVETIRTEAVTTLHFVPSMLRAFLEAPALDGGAGGALPIRRVIASGEALPADLVTRFRATLRAELHNLYGPTEAAVDVTSWPCAGGAHDRFAVPSVVPIGRPVASTALRLLDRQFRAVPVGASGELCIGGVQLARGYWRRPQLTAERFVPDGFAVGGERLYRTGDLARWLPNGVIEYLGRIDHQVKIRGFRIELGEIEATVLAHPGVRDAAVLVSDFPGGPRLVAVVVPAEAAGAGAGPEPDGAEEPFGAAHPLPGELRTLLAARLPEYMVPAALVPMPALPLSPNGKVDRKALLAQLAGRLPGSEGQLSGGAARVLPRTAVERFLADLWREILGVAEFGVHDRFFDLGGNSISGAILINRLQRELGEIVHVVVIFDAPTVARLAAYLVREHPAAVARRWGEEAMAGELAPGLPVGRVDAGRVEEMRRLIRPVAPAVVTARNPGAVLVLSPPRSGSTLLRVLLGGNPRLFAPPELELLAFDTLAEREAAFPGRDAFWLEGAIRTVMAARGWDVEEARALLASGAREGWTTQRFYGELQAWIGDRKLVDKTPSYALDGAVLRRAEQIFAEPRYLHLIRHPGGMIRSFEEAKLDQLFFRTPHSFSRRELAELIWLVSHQNIAGFLAEVEVRRQHRVRFEDLVRDPEPILREICDFLEIDYQPAMAEPYREKRERMTDGLHAESRMLGDIKFHQHRGVDAGVAEQWREHLSEDSLGEVTWSLAVALGYERRAALQRRPAGPSLVRLREGGTAPPLFLVHPVGGNVLCYGPLVQRLGAGQPVYGLQSAGLVDEALVDTAIEEMAVDYLAAVRQTQPRGPYRLAGWSMGGLIAFEMARRLAEVGEAVDLLALIDSVVPGASDDEPDPAELVFGLARDLAGLAGKEQDLEREKVEGLDPESDVLHVLRRAQEIGALPADLDWEQVKRLWRVFRANATAARRYVPGPFPGKAWVVASAKNPFRAAAGADLGWRRLAGDVDVELLDADHYDLLREPTVREIAQRLAARLTDGESAA